MEVLFILVGHKCSKYFGSLRVKPKLCVKKEKKQLIKSVWHAHHHGSNLKVDYLPDIRQNYTQLSPK